MPDDTTFQPVQLTPQEIASAQPAEPQFQPAQLTPQEIASAQPGTPPAQPLNPLRDFTPQQIVALQRQDPQNFDIIQQVMSDPAAQKDPVVRRNAEEAYHLLRQEPWYHDLPTPAQMAGSIGTIVKGFGKQASNYAYAAAGAPALGIAEATGAGDDQSRQELATEIQNKIATNWAGTETGLTGLISQIGKVVGSVGRVLHINKQLADYTPEDKSAAFQDALTQAQQIQAAMKGQGPLMQAVGGNVVPSLNLKPEEVATAAAGDPFSWEATGTGLGTAGKLTRATIPEAARTVIQDFSQNAVDKTLRYSVPAVTYPLAGAGLALGGAIKTAPGGISTGLALSAAHSLGLPEGVSGYLLGSLKGVSIPAVTALGERVAGAARELPSFGRQITGAEPVTGAYAQLGRDIVKSIPTAVADIGKGAAFDLGLAATSDTPQEKQAVGLGTTLGILGAGAATAKRALTGQLIAPREYTGNANYLPGTGTVPILEDLTRQAFPGLTVGQRTRFNATRDFLRGANPNADIFVSSGSDATAKALTDLGYSPDDAARLSSQGGVTTEINGHKVAIVNADSFDTAPHEARHAIENVMGEQALRQLDDEISSAYGTKNMDAIGRYYTSRVFNGNDPGANWQTPLLDVTGEGERMAREKLIQQGVPDDQLKQQSSDWGNVLTPAEMQDAANRYVAREIAAENFSTWFSKMGGDVNAKQQVPEKLAQWTAAVMRTFGAEPLAGQVSPLGLPLSSKVIQRVGEQARELGRPTVEPAEEPATGAPKPPEKEARNAVELARTAPDVPVAGGTKSQREILGTVAEAIANRTGVKLNYLSAPEEPAAATTSNRPVRRQMIEIFRSMPESARKLWEKTFFPDKVTKSKKGYQIQGWAPEVFAANAHKLAGMIATTPEMAGLSPYEVDPVTKSFTPEAWQQLYDDTARFVANQQSGRTGSGVPLEVPPGMQEKGFFKPPLRPGAGALDQQKADFLSMLFNFRLPDTSRLGGGKFPLNVAGQEVSRATIPGRVESPVTPRPEFTEGAVKKFPELKGRQILEVNPVRNALENAALRANKPMPSFIEAVQKLNLENIKEAEHAPEAPEFRGNTLTLSAGFAPKTNEPRAVKMAAIRDEDTGRVFEGPMHATATLDWLRDKHSDKIDEDGNLPPEVELDAWNSHPNLTEGYTTNGGEFLDREQALNRAEELGQYVRRRGDEGLESTAFTRQQELAKQGYKLPEVAAAFAPRNQEEEFAPRWYSQAARVTESKMPNAATGEQVAAILRNPQNGVKAEELKWSGLDDYLKGKHRVSKQEVQDYLKQNAVQVTEVTKGGKPLAAPEDVQALKDGFRQLNEEAYYRTPGDEDHEEVYQDRINKTQDKAKAAVNSGDWGTARISLERLAALHEEAGLDPQTADRLAKVAERLETPNPETKFETYQLPGGENYREILFTMPKKSAPENEGYGFKMSPETFRGGGQNFVSSHWDEPNVLAHVRFNDRTDSEGNKVKFIEEIQSDWHQKGRKEGYQVNLTSEQKELDDLLKKIDSSGWKSLSPAERARKHELVNAGVGDALMGKAGKEGVPDAPFKTSWHEMVFRRMVRQAAEEGADKLAWTTGDQQAERYDLSKRISRIEYRPDTQRLIANDLDKRRVLDEENVSPEKLADYIGKEAAEKLVNSPTIPGKLPYKVISGLDLKVGGEGMKGFYDKILVDYANKFGKKFGAKVEDTRLGAMQEGMKPNSTDPQKAREALSNGDDVYGRKTGGSFEEIKGNRDPLDYDEYFISPAASDFRPPDIAAQHIVHSLPITAEMKKSALEQGMAQFAPDKKTFIVRHGSTEMNNSDPDKDLIRGHIDVPLDDKGRREAGQAAQNIADQGGVDHVIASDLGRTQETGQIIADKNGATMELDPGLRPWHFGPTIEGKPTAKMLPEIQRLTENPDERPPEGETFNEFKDRFLDAFHRAQQNHADKNTAIVTHYRGTKLLDAWRATGTDNDTIDKAIFEKYDKDKTPGNVDVVDKAGSELAPEPEKQPAVDKAAELMRDANDDVSRQWAREYATQFAPKAEQGKLFQTEKEEQKPKRKPYEQMTDSEQDRALEEAEKYFAIGHGVDEETGEEGAGSNLDRTWIYDQGNRSIKSVPADKTHGMAFTHEVADRTFKGRYDAAKNTVSVAFPARERDKLDHEPTADDIPSGVYRAIQNQFGKTVKMVAFAPKKAGEPVDVDRILQSQHRIAANIPAGAKPLNIGDDLSVKSALAQPTMDKFTTEVADRIKSNPGFRDIKGTSPEKVLPQIVNRMAENIRFLFDKATDANRKLWRQWYDIANDLSHRLGNEFELPHFAVAGINARLSPQKDWYMNVTMTRKLLQTVAADPAWSESDKLFTRSVLENAEMMRRKDLAKKGEEPTQRSLDAFNDRIANIESLPEGKRLSEMTPEDAAYLIRSHNELRGDKIVVDHNFKPVKGAGKLTWQTYEALSDALKILRNPTLEEINTQLGSNHKVRSFYNNHVDPMNPQDVTIDTHAVAASHLMPYGSKHTPILENFGAVRHKNSGYSGSYFVTADAYRQVAKEVGLLPREVQSIVWEQMRNTLTPAGKRTPGLVKQTDAIWAKAEKGKITRDEARNQIYDLFQQVSAKPEAIP